MTHPTITTISSFNVPVTELEFPAVTVCNLNPFVTSRLDRIPQLKALEKISKSVTGGGIL